MSKFKVVYNPRKQAKDAKEGCELIGGAGYDFDLVVSRDKDGPGSKASKMAGKSIMMPYFFKGLPAPGGVRWPKQRCGGLKWLQGHLLQ